MSKIEDKSNLEFDQINIDLNHKTFDNFSLLISNNSCIKQFVNCIGNWNRIYSNKINYINPAHYNFINSRYWIGSEKMHSECFTIKKRIKNKFSYKLEKVTATKLIISYCNLQKYLNNDLLLSESLENSIKYVRVCLIPKFDFCLMESLLLQLKSKLKLVNYFELHVSAL